MSPASARARVGFAPKALNPTVVPAMTFETVVLPLEPLFDPLLEPLVQTLYRDAS